MTSDPRDFPFDFASYCRRVGLQQTPAVSEEGLHRLHAAQFYSIPFENFDIQLGRGIGLEPWVVFEKLVNRPRGGYCFELNSLMLMALGEIGFAARALLARVHLEPGISGRTHQISLVELDGRDWIMDVGFGAGGPRMPMLLSPGWQGESNLGAFRLEQREPYGWLLQSRIDDHWIDSYSFDLGYAGPMDIDLGNHYTSTSPRSRFTAKRVASIPTGTGLVSLNNFKLTEIHIGNRTTREISAGPAYLKVLADKFAIELDAVYTDLIHHGEDLTPG